ncbi:MAG: peptidoglycan DD-metalloendopeptidase family protein [Spirochaetales bacterium]|nr:peptidoglycan DD-metalloendopeptidase family protein [Spirochaetales bacterium]
MDRLGRGGFRPPHVRVLIAGAFVCASAAIACTHVARIVAEKSRYLYFPEGWVFRSPETESPPQAEPEITGPESGSVGGGSLGVLPLHIKSYRVRQGDTLSGIAERFNVDLDTIASLNREWGSGVHLVRIGEEIKVPNQDGIFIEISSSLEELCAEHSVPQEVVLQVNGIGPEAVARGVSLFFPGVQHSGIERSVVTGTAFLRPVFGFLSSAFGYRKDPFSDNVQFHRGLDIAAPTGTPVRVSLDGRVVAAGWDAVLGNYVLVRHQVGFSSVYGHLSQILVKRGATVSRGQRIGLVGSTGRSTGPHVHFELRRNGMPIDPAGLLTNRF